MSERFIVWDQNKPWLGGNIRGGDDMTDAPELWDWLIDNFEPKSICDVGCGEGHLMKYFHDRLIEVHGIEGLQSNKDNAADSIRDKIIVHDYTQGFGPMIPVDMVISCEFVEHVEEKFALYFLTQFCNCNVLIFTHAVPGQDGHHHVHCRDDEYWIAIMKIFNFRISPLTYQARTLANEANKVLWESILIFEKNGK